MLSQKLFVMALLVLSPVAQGDEMTQMARIKAAFSNLNASNMDILDDFYAPSVHFQDPIGTHQGLDAVKTYYTKMYKNVTWIKWEFTDTVSEGHKHLLVWTMRLKAKGLNGGKEVKIEGNSVLIFNEQNLVSYHRDYFDMGAFIYRHIPVLGWIVKKINHMMESQ